MKIKTLPKDIYQEYLAGVNYNAGIELYANVENNENFYTGKHWEGVSAPDLEKPVMPMLSNIVSHFVALIASDDWGISVTDASEDSEIISRRVTQELETIFECAKVKQANRMLIRNGAVDGDYCLHMWFDKDADTGTKAGGEKIRGIVRAEVIDNTNVIFGNEHEAEVERQPYIILVVRQYVDDAREEARRNGVPEREVMKIVADNDPNEYGSEHDSGKLVTTLLKYWRDTKTGTVWATKATESVVIMKPKDTEYSLYPIAYACWEPVKNSYHGVAAVTELIPNQIFVNKLYAMAMYYVKRMAFPKIVYDKTKLPNGWNNDLNKAIAVAGDPNQAVLRAAIAPEMSNQVFMMMDNVIGRTQELKGANDIMLGNVRPENTSAIIALTKAATVPLEMKKLANRQFIEDFIRAMIEIMATDYGMRKYRDADPETGEGKESTFDFKMLKERRLKLRVDVGDSSYWSEITQAQTADNMLAHGIIDPEAYIESLPEKFVRNKEVLLRGARRVMGKDEAGGPGGGMTMPPGGLPPGMMGLPQGLAPDMGGLPPGLAGGMPPEMGQGMMQPPLG